MTLTGIRLALLLTVLAPGAPAQSFRVSTGIVAQQVLQRGEQGHAVLRAGGESQNLKGKTIAARLATSDGKALPGFDWQPFARVQDGEWSGRWTNVPTGGPYKLELRAPGVPVFAVDGILVGDLWVLAGQSNMEGVGDLVDVQPPDARVHSFDMADQWRLAEEPLHTVLAAADPVHWARDGGVPRRLEGEALARYRASRRKGAGLGLPFAIEMVRRTGVPIGLIPCAHGGTSMAQWDPARRGEGGQSLYGAMLRRIRAVGGRVRGVLWYQGEAEARPNLVGDYRLKLEQFIAAVRQDTGPPDLPFHYVQLGRTASAGQDAEWNAIQEAQRLVAESVPGTGMVAAVDLALDDRIHIGTPDLKRLGRRLAHVATNGGHGLRLGTIMHERFDHGDQRHSYDLIRVKFTGVNGRLRAPERIGGFSLHGPDGQARPLIFRVIVDPQDGHSVLLYTQQPVPPGTLLRHGAGKDPFCNLRDEADLAVPVFGPVSPGEVVVRSP